jgi:hypothetical protein
MQRYGQGKTLAGVWAADTWSHLEKNMGCMYKKGKRVLPYFIVVSVNNRLNVCVSLCSPSPPYAAVACWGIDQEGIVNWLHHSDLAMMHGRYSGGLGCLEASAEHNGKHLWPNYVTVTPHHSCSFLQVLALDMSWSWTSSLIPCRLSLLLYLKSGHCASSHLFELASETLKLSLNLDSTWESYLCIARKNH